MEYKLKNLSAMPLDVPTLAGPVILPANGEITADLGALDTAVMEQSPYVEISESKAKAKTKPSSERGEKRLRDGTDAKLAE